MTVFAKNDAQERTGSRKNHVQLKQESLANAKVYARQHCVSL